MRIRFFRLMFFIAMVGMLTACSYAKFARTALKYEESEMYRQAVENYIYSLQKKPVKNDKARIGLMRSSKRYSDELEQKIAEAYGYQNDELVVRYFVELQKLQRDASLYQVEVDITGKAQGQFEEAKTRHLRAAYSKAQDMLDKDDFIEAEKLLGQVVQIDKTYERAAELYNYSRCEPLYRIGQKQLESMLFRSAYYSFGKLLGIDKSYKDAAFQQKEALQQAILTIALQPIINERTFPFLAQQIENETKMVFSKSNNPFLKLVSQDYTRLMLEEQRRALANNLPFDASQILPVRVLFAGNIITSHYTTSLARPFERKAFLRYVDKNKVVKFRKVNYFEYEQSCNANVIYYFEFVHAQNGIVLASDKIDRNYTDQIRFARSEYDYKDLFPGDWGEGRRDTMYTDFNRINSLKSSFEARDKLADKRSFESNFAVFAASEMLKKISAYDPEK